jgi:ABC-type nickel/cobalt efflux system permease component RcnA
MLFSVFFAGVAAGLVHVLTGPDHVAAVTPLAAAGPRRSARAGMHWGLGHTAGVIAIAVLALLLRGVLPIEALSHWSERIVGVVLIAIGIWGLRIALSSRLHAHVHEHGGQAHAHVHVHRHGHAVAGEGGTHAADAPNTANAPHAAAVPPPHRHTHAAFGVGVLHGLAGSSHFLGVLPALALPTHTAAVTYVAGFGAGSVAAMTAYAGCIGLVATRARHGGLRWYRALLTASGAAAVVTGCVWLASSAR